MPTRPARGAGVRASRPSYLYVDRPILNPRNRSPDPFDLTEPAVQQLSLAQRHLNNLAGENAALLATLTHSTASRLVVDSRDNQESPFFEVDLVVGHGNAQVMVWHNAMRVLTVEPLVCVISSRNVEYPPSLAYIGNAGLLDLFLLYAQLTVFIAHNYAASSDNTLIFIVDSHMLHTHHLLSQFSQYRYLTHYLSQVVVHRTNHPTVADLCSLIMPYLYRASGLRR